MAGLSQGSWGVTLHAPPGSASISVTQASVFSSGDWVS